MQTSGTPKRAKYAFVAPKATKAAFLRSEVMRARRSGTGSCRLVPVNIDFRFSLFDFSLRSRDAHDPSHGTGQNPKNINKHGPWDGGTGPQGVGGGVSGQPRFSNHFKAIQSNSNQSKKFPCAIAPNCSQLHLIAPKFKNIRSLIRVYLCRSVVKLLGPAQFKNFYVSYRHRCIKLVRFAMSVVALQLGERSHSEFCILNSAFCI